MSRAQPRRDRGRGSLSALSWIVVLTLVGGALLESKASAQTLPSSQAIALEPPTLLSDPSVAYPAGQTADVTVVLIVTVNADGTVRSAEPEKTTSPFSGLASEAALGWKFKPATRDGRPIAAKVKVAVFFHAPVVARDEPAPPSQTPRATNTTSSSDKNVDSKIDEVRVRGARSEPSRTATFTRAEVRQIPGVFGDPFRSIEVLPGVTPIISGLPFFFVRGAPPGNVGYFLDGVPVPYLFHVGAGPSVIHPALIDRVDLYPGGYPASFGRYAGGIVSGETVRPQKEAHGEYNVRVFDAGAIAEAPFADGKGTILLGGRYSYTAAILSLVNSDVVLDYWDYQGRVTYDLTKRDRLSVFAFGSYDFLGNKTDTGTTTVFGADFHRVDVRYDHRLNEDGNMRTAVTAGLDETQLDQGRVLRDRLVRARNEVEVRTSPETLFRFGVDAQADRYDVNLSTSDVDFFSRTDLSSGMRGDVVLDLGKRLEITPGARFDFFASQGATAVAIDPRLATRTVLTDRVRLISAIGLAHQTPSFIIPVPGLQPGGLKGGLQTAAQESAGFDVDLAPATTMTATVYHNAFFDLTDTLSLSNTGCQTAQAPGDTSSDSQPAGCPQTTATGANGQVVPQSQFETRANGNAYGFELYLKRRLTNRIGGFLSYTLSRSTRTANDRSFIAAFDRTHVVNAAIAYDLGRNWRAGSRVTFYTGLPTGIDPASGSSSRLAPFFRLDLRLEKRWQLGRRWWISLVAEWMNVTLSKESIASNCTLQGCEETKIGPVTIPSLGVEGGF